MRLPGDVRILCVIPARGGSKGVPRKNLRLLAGKPLVVYAIEAGLAAGVFFRVLVSTDDPEIQAIAIQYGAEAPFVRPKDLALDSTPMTPVIQHSVQIVEQEDKRKLDYVGILQPTEPLRRPEDVRAGIEKLMHTGADSVVSVCPVDRFHPVFIKRLEEDRLLPFCVEEPEGLLRQDVCPPAYIRNGVLFAVKRDVLMQQGSLYGKHSRPYVMPPTSFLTVDTEMDLWLAEKTLLQQQRFNSSRRGQ